MKILIIRLSSIGDIVLTSPVVRCLKKQIPDSEIHYLTKIQYREIIEANPFIDKKIYFDKNLNQMIDELKNENYDLIIDLHKNIRSHRIRWSLRKKTYSFPKINFQKWLMVNFKINRLPKIHIVDRYFKAVEKLGVKNDFAGLDFFISSKNEIQISSLPEKFRSRFIVFVIGAKFNTKKLPQHKIIAICKLIQKPILLIGGQEDKGIGDFIAQQSGEHVLNTCGKYSISQSASLIRQAEKVITHDTGMMHIAAAFKKEIISVWGSTIPDFGMTPYYGDVKIRSSKFEISNLSCRPCSKLGFSKCPKGHFKCMEDIDIIQVAASAHNLEHPSQSS